MTERFAADASIGVAWVHPGQVTPRSKALLRAVHDGAIVRVPALWFLETANALLVLVRRRKLTEGDRQEGLSALARLRIEVDHEMASIAFGKLSELASEHRLTIYDAAYLELARRAKLALACDDGALRSAARRCRVPLL